MPWRSLGRKFCACFLALLRSGWEYTCLINSCKSTFLWQLRQEDWIRLAEEWSCASSASDVELISLCSRSTCAAAARALPPLQHQPPCFRPLPRPPALCELPPWDPCERLAGAEGDAALLEAGGRAAVLASGRVTGGSTEAGATVLTGRGDNAGSFNLACCEGRLIATGSSVGGWITSSGMDAPVALTFSVV